MEKKMWKNCTAGQVTHENITHVLCILDTYNYKHTLRICNT